MEVKKKLAPRYNEPPTAMRNKEGKLLTKEKDIVKEAENHYREVFKEREIKQEFKNYRNYREQLCMKRLEECQKNKTPDWTEADVMCALKSLKTGKSQDPYELPNEIFRPNVAGGDLVKGITILMNRIKKECVYPTPMEFCNVTNLYKNKGERSIYKSYRGIFRTPIFRNIWTNFSIWMNMKPLMKT